MAFGEYLHCLLYTSIDLMHDDLFWQSLGNTVYMCLVGLPLNLIAALGLAMLLHQKLKGRPVFRTIFYLPTVVPVVASVMLFMWILNPEYGLINMFLGLFGICLLYTSRCV